MNVTRPVPETWADNAYRIECSGYERQMLLGSLERAIKHHEHKAATLKTPGSVRTHQRTAETLADISNAIRMA